MSKRTDDIKKTPEERKADRAESENPLNPDDLLSSGSTLLNLACSNNPFGAFLKGHYYFLVGDSKSGKTWLSMTCFAEASLNPNFENYRLIYDNVEQGALFDVAKYFGQATAERVDPPSYDDDEEPVYSRTIEDFYFHIDDAIKEGTPFVYVLDSMDALTSEDESKKFEETKKAMRSGKEITGSYGDGKAKRNSAGIRQLLRPLKSSGSILIIVNQTRDNLGFGFEKKTRSGGRALRFYSTVEMWSSVKKRIKKTVRGKTRVIGSRLSLQLKKNRLTGLEPTVEIPIYPSHGIDDVGSCVDYLIDEGVWKKGSKGISAPEFDFSGSYEKLIRHIEEEELEAEVSELVGSTWNGILMQSAVQRKPRYQ